MNAKSTGPGHFRLLTNVLHSTSSSALCRGSAAYQRIADARDKPEHDERGVGQLSQQSEAHRSGGFRP
ncbi:hypothetical protein GFL51_03890 [Rhizobium leguminosarum bv. viciae]|nr:hypothetical protein [Rhizobium leguminosarum bv. viciae]